MRFITSSDKVTVKTASTHTKDGVWYLNIVYFVEDDQRIVEYSFPRIRIPIEHARIVQNYADTYPSSFTLELPYKDLSIEPRSDGQIYTKRIIKVKQKEMTLSEIEAALGYKVKIVNEKETPEDDGVNKSWYGM